MVVDREFLASDHALMVPKTADGRVLFAVPWLGKVILVPQIVRATTWNANRNPSRKKWRSSSGNLRAICARRPGQSDIS